MQKMQCEQCNILVCSNDDKCTGQKKILIPKRMPIVWGIVAFLIAFALSLGLKLAFDVKVCDTCLWTDYIFNPILFVIVTSTLLLTIGLSSYQYFKSTKDDILKDWESRDFLGILINVGIGVFIVGIAAVIFSIIAAIISYILSLILFNIAGLLIPKNGIWYSFDKAYVFAALVLGSASSLVTGIGKFVYNWYTGQDQKPCVYELLKKEEKDRKEREKQERKDKEEQERKHKQQPAISEKDIKAQLNILQKCEQNALLTQERIKKKNQDQEYKKTLQFLEYNLIKIEQMRKDCLAELWNVEIMRFRQKLEEIRSVKITSFEIADDNYEKLQNMISCANREMLEEWSKDSSIASTERGKQYIKLLKETVKDCERMEKVFLNSQAILSSSKQHSQEELDKISLALKNCDTFDKDELLENMFNTNAKLKEEFKHWQGEYDKEREKIEIDSSFFSYSSYSERPKEPLYRKYKQ